MEDVLGIAPQTIFGLDPIVIPSTEHITSGDWFLEEIPGVEVPVSRA